jgi:hypothetical protein
MTIDDENRAADRGAAPGRGLTSRARFAIAAVGLAAGLGAGAYVITDNLVNRGATTTEAGTPAHQPPDAGAGSWTPAPTASAESPQASPSSQGVAQSISPDVAKKIREAREKMAKDGVKVDRPVDPQAAQATSDVSMTTTGSLKEGGILRLVAAREDLTGQRELAYVVGGLMRHRGVLCSQTFKFSTNPVAKKRDNLLMCWRTSAKKSVIAMVVDPKGHPSPDKAVNALEKKWRTMG